METKMVKDECFDDLMYRFIIEIWSPVIGVLGLNEEALKTLSDKIMKFPDLSKENKRAIIDVLKLKSDNSTDRVDRNISRACVRALEKLEIRLTHEEQFLQKRVKDLEDKIEAFHSAHPKGEKKTLEKKAADEPEENVRVNPTY